MRIHCVHLGEQVNGPGDSRPESEIDDHLEFAQALTYIHKCSNHII